MQNDETGLSPKPLVRLTHVTRDCDPSGKDVSMGSLPVSSSSNTTPNP